MAAETSPEVQAGEHPVVLFDGYCHLCDGTVNFIIARDRRAQFRFAPLQSSAGEALLQQCGLPARAESIVLVEGKRCFTRSGAALGMRSALPRRGMGISLNGGR